MVDVPELPVPDFPPLLMGVPDCSRFDGCPGLLPVSRTAFPECSRDLMGVPDCSPECSRDLMGVPEFVPEFDNLIGIPEFYLPEFYPRAEHSTLDIYIQ